MQTIQEVKGNHNFIEILFSVPNKVLKFIQLSGTLSINEQIVMDVR